jgi:hypothetical protein
MDTRLPYWGSVIFSAVSLVLLVVNISLANTNHALQVDVQQRQAVVNSGPTFSQLNQALVQAMAEDAVKNNNTQLRDLLASQGITLKSNPDATASTAKPTK